MKFIRAILAAFRHVPPEPKLIYVTTITCNHITTKEWTNEHLKY